MNESTTLIFELFVLCGICTGFCLYYLINLANRYNLLAESNERTSHFGEVPSIGGIAFFINFLIALGVTQFFGDWNTGMALMIGTSIIVFVGIRDDILDLPIRRKLPLQLFAIILVLFMSGLKIEGLYGFLYIDQVPAWISYPLSFLLVLFFMQAYNLIDGIDGHAASIGIIIFGSFSVFFWLIQDYLFLTISAVSLVGLLVYLCYNLSKLYKIFMGDTGTLLIGFLIGFSIIRILSYTPEQVAVLPFRGQFLPVLLLAILFVPIFDVFRVMIVRKRSGKPIFSPDRNHVHHVLTDAGFSHRRASFFSASFSLSFAFVIFLIIQSESVILLGIAVLIFLLLVNLLLIRLGKTYRAKKLKVLIRKPVMKYSKLFKALGLYNFLV
ncbi:MraY family glycosyltransferase [Aureitalea marina]|uniref:MraY family glycosyltransferase n=1 Tax=Aureitalea marina TaxID=930804 RepID=UPI000CF2E859|nr:MraY family glycosyltransferase [Aureitalea marina]